MFLGALRDILLNIVLSFCSVEDLFVNRNRLTLVSKSWSKIAALPSYHQLVQKFIKRDLCHETTESKVLNYFSGKSFQQIFDDDRFGWKSYYKKPKLVYHKGLLDLFFLHAFFSYPYTREKKIFQSINLGFIF